MIHLSTILLNILESWELNVMYLENDKITISQIKENNYNGIIISPGPGTPEDKKYFGICSDVIKDIGPTTPILEFV